MDTVKSSLSFTSLKYYLAQAAGATIAFLALPVLTRLYPPAVYGQYLLIISAVVLINALCMHWLGQSTARFLPGNRQAGKLRTQINSLTTLMALGAGLVSSASILLVPGLHAALPLVPLVALYSFFSAIGAVQSIVHQALENSARFALFLLVQGTVPPLLAVGLSYVVGATLPVLLGSQLLGSLSAILVLGAASLFQFARVEGEVVVRFLHYGLPLLGWVVGAQLLNSLDRFMLAHYLGTETAGIYTANYNLVISAQSFLFGPLLLAVHPRLMQLWNNGDPGYRTVLRQAIYVFVVYASLSLGFFFINHQTIGKLLMGHAYRSGHALMPWISLGHILWGYAAYLNKELEFTHQTWKMGLLAFVAAGVNVLLNLALIPVYGMAATAATTILSYAAYLILIYSFSPRRINLLPGPGAFSAMVLIPALLYGVYAFANVLAPMSPIGNLVLVVSTGGVLFLAFILLMSATAGFGGPPREKTSP